MISEGSTLSSKYGLAHQDGGADVEPVVTLCLPSASSTAETVLRTDPQNSLPGSCGLLVSQLSQGIAFLLLAALSPRNSVDIMLLCSCDRII